jgi:hypothetical protein
MRKISLWLLFALTLAGCSSAPQARFANHAFSISSMESGFTIRGRLHGSFGYTNGQFLVTVDGGTVVSTFDDQSGVHLLPMIAGRGPKDARRVAEGESKSIGDYRKLVPRELTETLNFTFPLPRDFDPDKQWLVFEFIQTNGHSTFICDTHNLSERNAAAGGLRPGWLCWANPK